MTPVTVHIIRAFVGPRHGILETIWLEYVRAHKDELILVVHENCGPDQRPHDVMLNTIWRDRNVGKFTPRHVITEFDFLPAPSFAQKARQERLDLVEPIVAARYYTRDSRQQLIAHNKPGAWFILTSPSLLKADPCFWAGCGGDPANNLGDDLAQAGQHVRLLDQTDCFPRHYGLALPGYGEHLFWSRHYNDTDNRAVPYIADIHRGVDAAIDEWWRQWRR